MSRLLLILVIPLLLLIGGFFWLSRPIIDHLKIDSVIQAQEAAVVKVIDGDTFEARFNNQQYMIRMIGIDTPETVDPHRADGCYGHQASQMAKQLLSGKTVYLVADIEDQDKYQRLLRYVYLPVNHHQLLFVNDYLMRSGQAKILNIAPNDKFHQQLSQAEDFAQQHQLGLWQSC